MKRLVIPTIILLLFVSCQKEVYYNISTTVNPKDAGSISVSPAGPSVLEGTAVSFTAQPKGDYVFTGWSGSFSGTENPKTVTITSDLAVTANFTLKDYPLAISTEGEGAVLERVISTKSDYASGTVVELTAVPATGWSFDHWNGDLSGKENPAKITITSAKAINAVFTKNQYTYNLKIIGPGVVNESLVQTKSVEYGTLIHLTAIPNIFENAVFVGWKGDIESTEVSIDISINSDTSITAVFMPACAQRKTRSYPLPDLKQPSYFYNRIYIDEFFPGFPYAAYQRLPIDYNRDGYLDIITSTYNLPFGGKTDADRIPVGFYLGHSDGSFTVDPQNDCRIPGALHVRKMICGDYNNDGFPDIGLLGQGYDTDMRINYEEYLANPYPGEYPILLMSMPNGVYEGVRLTELDGGFFHGGASGDFDNDGDLDIFLCDNMRESGILINDGTGAFSYHTELIENELFHSFFNAELYDIDKDGYLDLICGGHDWEDKKYYETGDASYTNTPLIFWGNGTSFRDVDNTRLPETHIEGFGLVNDFFFYDLDSDGIEELILSRSGDGERGSVGFYEGWAIQVLHRNGRSFYDVTDSFIDQNQSYHRSDPYYEWLVYINIAQSQQDGKTYLLGAYDDSTHPETEKLFELSNDSRLKRLMKEGDRDVSGVCIYSDSFSGADYSSCLSHIDVACPIDSYSGDFCIHWSIEKAWQQSLSYIMPKMNLFPLVQQGYELEFFVKYTNPHLKLCVNLETKYIYVNNQPYKHLAYGYGFYSLPSAYADGEWHRIHVPLSDFYHCDDCDDSGWNEIEVFKMWVISEDTVGAEFYIDEIRIRKVLPE